MQNNTGPHLILAGPGTGKTTFLINKTTSLFQLISSKNEGIVICTFTRKATEELITRIYSKLSVKEINRVNFIIGTIHSICFDLLARYSDKDFSDYQILPEESQVHFIHSKLKNLGYSNDRIKKMIFGSVYPLYLAKVVKKGRTQQELDQVIKWLTGYTQKQIEKHISERTSFETFFASAKLHPNAILITGSICGYRIEEIEDPLTKKVRYLDKLVDELAKGKKMDKILREA